MKLVRALLPLATTLALGSVLPPAGQTPQLSQMPPAAASKPSASPPARSPRPLALPPASAPKVFVLPRAGVSPNKGPQSPLPSIIHIPRCYFVFGLQSRAGRTEFTDRAERVLALPSQCRSLLIAGRPPVPR